MTSARRPALLVFLWSCLLAALVATSAWAAPTTGSLRVEVADDDGLPIPGADLTLSGDTLLGGPRQQRSDGQGEALFAELPPGRYRLDVGRDAFVGVTVIGLSVEANREALQRVTLRTAGSEEIVVEARQQAVDVSGTTQGQVLTKEFLRNVPVGHTYQQAVSMASGVTGGDAGNPNMAGGAYNENTYGAEEYQHPGFHDTVAAAQDRLSTFAVDVDTASYALARAKLTEGVLPDPAGVRVEEFVNAFPYELGGGPRTGPPLAIRTEVARHPLREGSVLLSVALQSRPAPLDRKPLHLTFLVDVSGSMASSDKIGLVRESLHHLVDGLGDEDAIALVTYAGATRVVLEPTWTVHKAAIHAAIDALQVGGGTAMGDGLALAYGMAGRLWRDGVEDRVIVLTDGDANVGRASTEQLQQIVAGWAGKGIGLSVVGVGQGNYKDARLEALADAGDGNYHYVDSSAEAERVFGRDLVANLTTVARDVKVQLEFPPEAVLSWRQIGYEDRAVADEDFRNDAVDGGEVGYGHQVTALYELELRDHPQGDLVRVAVRAEPPGREAPAIEFTAARAASDPIVAWSEASPALRWATAAATFAEVLRRSPVEAETSWSDVLRLVDGALDPDRDDESELRDLVLRAAALSGEPLAAR